MAANSVFCRSTADLNLNGDVFAKMYARLGKDDARNVNEARR